MKRTRAAAALLFAARRFAAGEPAIGTAPPRIPQARLRAFEGVVPKSTNWCTLTVDEAAAAPEREQVA